MDDLGLRDADVKQYEAPTRPLSVRHSPRARPPAAAPRVLTYSAKDVIDDRISVPAQHSLVRLSKNPATSADAVRMLEEVKAGRLAGIYCINFEKSAQRALRLGKTWWTVLPKGKDAVLMVDPDDLMRGKPLIAYRRELDPDCGLLKGEKRFVAQSAKLDAGIHKAWQTYLRFRNGRSGCHYNQSALKSGRFYEKNILQKIDSLECGRWARVISEPSPTEGGREQNIVRVEWSVYGQGDLEIDEVSQGQLLNCPLPATIAAMVNTNRIRRDMTSEMNRCALSIDKTAGSEPINWTWRMTDRYFNVSFRDGRSENVTDLFYVHKCRVARCTPPIDLFYAKSTRDRLWISIIEKAYAKHIGGTSEGYRSLEHLNLGDVMKDFCGIEYAIDIQKRIVLKNNLQANASFDDTLKQVLRNASKNPTTAATPDHLQENLINELKLLQDHAYAVLGFNSSNVLLYDAYRGDRLSISYNRFKEAFKGVISAPNRR